MWKKMLCTHKIFNYYWWHVMVLKRTCFFLTSDQRLCCFLKSLSSTWCGVAVTVIEIYCSSWRKYIRFLLLCLEKKYNTSKRKHHLWSLWKTSSSSLTLYFCLLFVNFIHLNLWICIYIYSIYYVIVKKKKINAQQREQNGLLSLVDVGWRPLCWF